MQPVLHLKHSHPFMGNIRIPVICVMSHDVPQKNSKLSVQCGGRKEILGKYELELVSKSNQGGQSPIYNNKAEEKVL